MLRQFPFTPLFIIGVTLFGFMSESYSQTSASSVAANTPAAKTVIASKPTWNELSTDQKIALAPLQTEWESLSTLSKKKLMEIAKRYPSMKPEEQARFQERMREWIKLTPEQRMLARENYAKATQLPAEKKSTQWQQYQQLSEDDKKRLAAESEKKKSVTNLPPDAHKNPKTLAPIKVGPKPNVTSTEIKPAVNSSGKISVPPSQPSPVQVQPNVELPGQTTNTASQVSASVTNAVNVGTASK